MTRLSETWRRLLFLFRRRKFDDEVGEEMRFHIEMMMRENLSAGMPEQQARYDALRRFGNRRRMEEESRDVWIYRTLLALAQDLRYGLRMMARAPGFTAVAVLSLALGIGANTAIFSVIDSLLLKMLPVREPQRLVRVSIEGFTIGNISMVDFSYPAYTRLRDNNQVLDELMAMGRSGKQDIAYNGLGTAGRVESVRMILVSGNYFSTLGVNPVIGRALTPDDDKAASGQGVAVISYNYWKRRFGRDRSVVGRTFALADASFTIVGVAPAAFFGTEVGESPDIFAPLAMEPVLGRDQSMLEHAGSSWLSLMGRLKPGVGRSQAEADLNVVYRPILDQGSAIDDPKWKEAFLRQRIAVTPGGRGNSNLRENVSKPLGILMGIVGMVLLIACANVANLMLARGAARRKEISVRMAIGAARSRLVRQLFTESLMLAVVGGALGLLVASWGSDALVKLVSTRSSPATLNTSPDIRVLTFTAAVAALTGILFGLAPALRATRISLTPALNDRAGSGSSRGRVAKSLVSAQIMLSLLLLIGAGLFVHSLERLRTQDLGFDRVGVLQVSWTATGYTNGRLASLLDTVNQRVSSLPGVLSVSLSSTGLLTGNIAIGSISADGISEQPNENENCYFDKVSTNFFETVGMQVLKGRPFGPEDNAGAPKVAVINQTAARRYFGKSDPIGKRFHENSKNKELIAVVGIAKDAKYLDVRSDSIAMVYTPYVQADKNGFQGLNSLEVRSVGDPAQLSAAIRNEFYSLDRNLAIDSIIPLGELADESLVQERAIATLASFFGLLALLLASIGLYGIMSYSVNRRTAEVGIRLALGAAPAAVQWLILRETLLLLAIGIIGGLLAALALTRLLTSLLFGLSAIDPAALILATVVLAGASALAGYLPARRAARVDPMTALRCE